MKNSIIILDRDGVINYESEEYIKSPTEWIPIPGSLEAIAQLNRAGFRVIVVTNQSGVARGYYDLATLEKIHDKFHHLLKAAGGKVEEIFFCPHHPDEKCECRKPKPALLYQVRDKYKANLSEIYFVGDSIVDIEVAKAVGCKPILVLTGKGKKTLKENPSLESVLCFEDLAAVAHFVTEDLCTS